MCDIGTRSMCVCVCHIGTRSVCVCVMHVHAVLLLYYCAMHARVCAGNGLMCSTHAGMNFLAAVLLLQVRAMHAQRRIISPLRVR